MDEPSENIESVVEQAKKEAEEEVKYETGPLYKTSGSVGLFFISLFPRFNPTLCSNVGLASLFVNPVILIFLV